jgi:hypothetical protein
MIQAPLEGGGELCTKGMILGVYIEKWDWHNVGDLA